MFLLQFLTTKVCFGCGLGGVWWLNMGRNGAKNGSLRPFVAWVAGGWIWVSGWFVGFCCAGWGVFVCGVADVIVFEFFVMLGQAASERAGRWRWRGWRWCGLFRAAGRGGRVRWGRGWGCGCRARRGCCCRR